MESILEELYYGNISPFARTYSDNHAYMEASRLRERNRDKLLVLLGEQGKELLEKYEEAQSDMDDVVLFDRFAYGLRFGVLLMSEVFAGSV